MKIRTHTKAGQVNREKERAEKLIEYPCNSWGTSEAGYPYRQGGLIRNI